MCGKRFVSVCGMLLVCSLLFVSAFPMQVCAEEVTAAALLEAHVQAGADGTVTFTVPIDGSIRAFDFGVAFCVQEAEVVAYGFTAAFLDACADCSGTAIDHYFEEGERVSDTSRYIVFGGMANAGAVYTGDFAYVTFRLKTAQATVYVIKDSAAYAHVDEITANGTAYTLTADAVGSAGSRESGNDTGSQSGGQSAENTAGSQSSDAVGGTAGSQSSDAVGGTAGSQSAGSTAAEANSIASAKSSAESEKGVKAPASSADGSTSLKSPARTGDRAQPSVYLALSVPAVFAVYCCTRRNRKGKS